METTICYFTGTGNSLALSKILSENLKECKIESIAKFKSIKEFVIENEYAGFIFPNHYGKVPDIVKNFLNICNFKNVKYIFSVISGGSGSGYAFNELKSILKQKNAFLNAVCEITMPGNYIIAPYYAFVNRNDPAKKILFGKSKKKMISFAQAIKEQKNVFEIKNNSIKFISKLFNISNNLSNRKIWDKNFYSEPNCNSCGICGKVCPADNIEFASGKPRWLHNCQLCMACIQLCPKEAIQYKNKTKNKKRYHHPEITIKEIIG